jgi:flagellar motility protein MotE (MotC chaperone)
MPAAARVADPNGAVAAAAQPSLARVAPAAAGSRAAVYRRIARILITMKPAEAAGIMSHLTDDQVEGIVRAVGVRQAATLLAQLPTARAAALSRRLIERPSLEE